MNKTPQIMAAAIQNIWEAINYMNGHRRDTHYLPCPEFPKKITVISEDVTLTCKF